MLWRRLRGILGLALVWGIAWAPLLAVLSGIVALAFGATQFLSSTIFDGFFYGFNWGFAAGALFGGVLMLAEQKRGFAKLTPWRGALWGAVGGLWFPIALTVATGRNPGSMIAFFSATVALTTLMGAVSGWVTVRMAHAGREPAVPPALEGADPLASTASELTPSARERSV